MKSILLGTRGSELALAQTILTTQALEAAWPELAVAHEIIHTTGDLRLDLRLSGVTPGVDKGVFIKELETALAEGRVHAAVHSLKDVPTDLPEGFHLTAVLPRAATNDVLISKHEGGIAGLPHGAKVATSSLRRQRQLRWMRPDVRVVEIRGNVGTRLRKVGEAPDIDALMLARAGLDRLGLTPAGLHVTVLPQTEFLPAASQGAVAIEVYGDDARVAEIFSRINHEPTMQAVLAEREFLRLLQAGCHTPVGLHTWIEAGRLKMKAVVFDEADEASTPRFAEAEGDSAQPELSARALFERLG